jgi:hypothetical protein
MSRKSMVRRLFLVLFLVLFFVFLVLEQVAVLPGLAILFFFILIDVVGDDVQMDGMRLRDLQLGLALGAAEDFPFLYFVFIDINFRGTFWATDHGSILRKVSESRA